MSGEPIEIRLAVEYINIVVFHREVLFEDRFQFQIRIGKIEDDGTSLIMDCLPPGLDIKFGYSPQKHLHYNSLPRQIYATKPINCTDLLRLDPLVKNMLFVKWTPDHNNYALTMSLVVPYTVDTLIGHLREKEGRSSEETKNFIVKMIADGDPDLILGQPDYCCSLLCPLSRKRMEIPVKSIGCDHLQCFDAKTFLSMNEKTPKWKCPICNISCMYDELEIQNYFLEIVTSPTLNVDCTNIQFISDGTWIACENDKTNTMNNTPDMVKLMGLFENKCIFKEFE